MNKNPLWLAVAIALVGSFEGLRTRAYLDVVDVPTICYGETKNVHLGDRATKQQCDEKLAARLREFSEGIDSCLTVPITDNQRVSYVSLAYNVGIVTFCKSSVLRLANKQDVAGSCDAILLYTRAGGKIIPGLVNRRKKEREICLQP